MINTETVIVFGVGFLLGLLIGIFFLINVYREKKLLALKAQRSVTKGMISENIAPLLPGFPGEISEAKFVGKPIDYLIFKGIDQENITEVIFVEVKSGKSSTLSNNERSLKEAIEAKRVSWKLYETNKF